MTNNVKKPCNNCPFLKTTQKGWLGAKKATEIIDSTNNDKTFSCHKTIGSNKENYKICAGSLILLEKEKKSDSNFIIRFGKAMGLISEIDKSEYEKIFDSSDEFIEKHS